MVLFRAVTCYSTPRHAVQGRDVLWHASRTDRRRRDASHKTGWLALVTANAAVPAVGARFLSFCSLSASWSAAGRPCMRMGNCFVHVM